MKNLKEDQEQKEKNLKNKKPDKGDNGLNDYAKYSGIAFQMIGVILITVWGGTKLDELLSLKTPVFTIVLSLLGVFSAIYIAIKDFIK